MVTVDISQLFIGKTKKDEPNNYIKELFELYPCSAVEKILAFQNISHDQQKGAHTFWTVSGHDLREKVNDDIRLEAILKKVLPQYSGSNMVLFRGENKKRYNNMGIGFCWTSKIETARMFARGLNSHLFGGVVLKYEFAPQQIIAGPSDHSLYLGESEFTIAPSSLDYNKIELLESYPAV